MKPKKIVKMKIISRIVGSTHGFYSMRQASIPCGTQRRHPQDRLEVEDLRHTDRTRFDRYTLHISLVANPW
jgi:hypothetical protein